MPKEIIRNSSTLGNDKSFHAEVRWNRTQYAQVATVKDDEGVGEVNGWFVDLDREGLNRMIRVLRKARDQAFGRDE